MMFINILTKVFISFVIIDILISVDASLVTQWRKDNFDSLNFDDHIRKFDKHMESATSSLFQFRKKHHVNKALKHIERAKTEVKGNFSENNSPGRVISKAEKLNKYLLKWGQEELYR